jgi:predicted RNA binding protein YcfA (HicA-like mRNA interferase family)
MTAREVMNRLRREGWAERPVAGTHAVFSRADHGNITVPHHPSSLRRGTLRSIVRAAGWEWPPKR